MKNKRNRNPKLAIELLGPRLALSATALATEDFEQIFIDADTNEDNALSSKECTVSAKALRSDLATLRTQYNADRKSLWREYKAEVKSLAEELQDSLRDAMTDEDRRLARSLYDDAVKEAIDVFTQDTSDLLVSYNERRQIVNVGSKLLADIGKRLQSGRMAGDANRNKILEFEELVGVAAIDGDSASISRSEVNARATTRPQSDTVAPTVAIEHAAILLPGEASSLTFRFSEAVTFTAASLNVTGGVLSALTGTGAVYTATLVGNAGAESVTISIPAGSFVDVSGNRNNTAASAVISISAPPGPSPVDTVAPNLTIAFDRQSISIGQTSLVSFSFTEQVAGFTLDDIRVGGGGLSQLNGEGARYTAIFTPLVNSTANGSVIVPANAFSDASGNANTSESSALVAVDTRPSSSLPPSVAFAAITARGGDVFAYKIEATDSPTLFSADPLPSGLQIDSARGVISGILPTAQTVYRINIAATNSAGTGRAVLELSVQGVAVPVIVSPLTATAKIGRPFAYGIGALGQPVSFAADGLPSGLRIDRVTGVISGAPSASSTGMYDVLLSATNESGRQGSAVLQLTVSDGEQRQIRDYVGSFTPIAVPEPSIAVPTSAAVTVDEGFGVNRINVTRQPMRDTQVLDRIVAFDPNVDSLYAGAIVQGKDLPNGILNSITTDRMPVTLTVTGLNVPAGTRLSATVQPTLANYTNTVFADLVAQQVNSEQAARSVFTMRGISTVEEGMLKLGASYRWVGGSVQGSFVRSTSVQTSAVMVRYTQNYFQVSVDPPSHPGAYFGVDATLGEVQEKFGVPAAGNPPAYVSSISYGRELWMLVESSKTRESMEANLSAAFNGLVAGGGLSVTAQQRAELDSYSYQVFVLGGGGSAAAKVVTTGIDGVAQYVRDGANFSPQSPGAPISYVAKYLWNSDIARVSSVADYTLVTSRANPQAMLSRAMWYFRTHDDDKDRNNTLTLTLYDKAGTAVASQSGLGGGVWPDHTDAVLQLSIPFNTITKERMLGGTIRTAMGGDDGGWNFECRVELEWTDGTKSISHISRRRWNDWGSADLRIS